MIRYCRIVIDSLHRGCHTFFFFLAVHFTQKNTILLRFVRCCTMAVIGKWIHQTCCCERVLTYQILHVLTYAFQALPSAPSTSSHTVRYECAERCVQKRFNLGQWTVEPHFHIIMCVFPRHWPRITYAFSAAGVTRLLWTSGAAENQVDHGSASPPACTACTVTRLAVVRPQRQSAAPAPSVALDLSAFRCSNSSLSSPISACTPLFNLSTREMRFRVMTMTSKHLNC